MDRELYETASETYELSKHKHFQCSFELECKLFARIFEISLSRFHTFLEARARILSRLPAEILTTIDDLKKFSWGYMSKETKMLLKNFLESSEK